VNDLILIPSLPEFRALYGEADAPARREPLPVHRRDGVDWAICGIGPAATAATAALLATELKPRRVILAGIAGAFPQSGLKPGDVVQAKSEVLADLGYRDAAGFHNLDEMGLTMLPRAGGALGCGYSLEPLADGAAAGFLTVAQITSDRETADALWARYGAGVENMEGAAAAMACALMGVRFFEVRAVSNFTGPRDRDAWRVDEALAALRRWLERHF